MLARCWAIRWALLAACWATSAARADSLWDLDRIARDPLEVRVRVEDSTRVWGRTVKVRHIFYTSHEWKGEKVRISARVAIPLAAERLPGMVFVGSHLGSAAELAARFNVAVLDMDPPGWGDSGGPLDTYENWHNVLGDPRESWMWHACTAAMRGVTYLSGLPEVDANAIGVTGVSRTGTVTMICNGVDPRLRLAVVMMAAGDIVAALDCGSWANWIVRDGDLKAPIPDYFRVFARYYDPIQYADTQHGALIMILGTLDEYFPLVTAARTFERVAGAKCLSLIPNYDHSDYSMNDIPALQIRRNMDEPWVQVYPAAVSQGIASYLRTRDGLPPGPSLKVSRQGGMLRLVAEGGRLAGIRRMTAAYSLDDGYTYRSLVLRGAGGVYRGSIAATEDEYGHLAAFAQADYGLGFALSSAPVFGSEFHLRLRPHPLAQDAPMKLTAVQSRYRSTIDELPPLASSAWHNEYRHTAPVAVMVPDGFPGSGRDLESVGWRLGGEGVYALAPSMRGRGGLRGLPDAGGRELYDLRDAVEQLVAQDANASASASSVALVGYGIGGLQALLCAERFPDQFAAVIAFSPPPGWQAVFEGSSADGRLALRKAIGGTPLSAAARYAARDAVLGAGNIAHLPIHLFYDRADPYFADSEPALFRRLTELGAEHVFLHVADHSGQLNAWRYWANPDSPDLVDAEQAFIKDLRRGDWQRPRLPTKGSLVVPGYVVAGPFSVWLNEGVNAVGSVDYVLGEDSKAFHVQVTQGPETVTVAVTLPHLVGEEFDAFLDGAPLRGQWRPRALVAAFRVGLGESATVEFRRRPVQPTGGGPTHVPRLPRRQESSGGRAHTDLALAGAGGRA